MAEKDANTQQTGNEVAILERNAVDIVSDRIRELHRKGQIRFPANYSPENALKAAWLAIQEAKDKDDKPALQVCTKSSIANALLDMVVQGLNPAKDQCYFVVYGNQLACMRSYFGSMAVVQNYVAPNAKIWHGVVYEGDEFEYEIRRGLCVPTVHRQKLANIKPDKIVGAYCVVEDENGNVLNSEIMTFAQIQQAWKHSKTYRPGGNSFHNTEPDQACLRTVINRTCKFVINSSDDSYLVAVANRTDELATEAEMEAEEAEHANGVVIDVAPESVRESEPAEEASSSQPGREAPAQDPSGSTAPVGAERAPEPVAVGAQPSLMPDF